MKYPARAAGTAAMLVALALPTPALAQKAGGVLRAYHRESPPSGSIHEDASISTVGAFMAVFNNLIMFDPDSGRAGPDTIVPELATEWAWDEGRTRLTFKLRQGVNWHDGKPFTSADVKCTWDMLTEKRKGGWRKNPRQEWWSNVKDVTTAGEHEVTFQLGRPQASFLMLLAAGYSPVYSCHVDGRDMRQKPVGTGPFKVVEFKANDFIKLAKNPDYWKPGRPYLDGVEWKIITNRSTRILGFVAGEFDLTFASDITVPLLKDIKAQAPSAVCEITPTNVQGQLLVNREAPPFDDAKIRRALMLTLDRKAFNDILGEGQYRIGGIMLPAPEGSWATPPERLADIPGYGPDVEKSREEARRIMREAGYGPDKPLKIKIGTRNLATYRDAAVILIDHLKQVHIEGELDVMESAIWFTKLARKDYQIGMNLSGIGLDDPDVVLYEGYACGSERNYTNYCDRELQAKFDEQSATLDVEKRKQLVWEIDRKLQEDAARPILYHVRAGTCWQQQVKGIRMFSNNQYAPWRLESVWLDK